MLCVNAFFRKLCHNPLVLKFSAILISALISMPAFSAGLGFNPFDRSSPTSATGSSKPTPTAPVPAAAPAAKPAPSVVSAPKQPPQANKGPESLNKK